MARPSELTRADRAFKFVQKVKTNHDTNVHEKFNSYVKSAPTMILVNGLAQALAFWKEKSVGQSADSKAYSELLGFLNGTDTQGNQPLLEKVVNSFNSDQYRTATAKVMAELKWLKRFASAEFKKKG
ncbi:MAG: hypothetical protein AMXMBFR48_14480 [Ignavibacteriales bacterium]